jgi:hypothetical protein
MIPGEVVAAEGPLELNPGRERRRLVAENTGDRPPVEATALSRQLAGACSGLYIGQQSLAEEVRQVVRRDPLLLTDVR